jgi:hypothetical protein
MTRRKRSRDVGATATIEVLAEAIYDAAVRQDTPVVQKLLLSVAGKHGPDGVVTCMCRWADRFFADMGMSRENFGRNATLSMTAVRESGEPVDPAAKLAVQFLVSRWYMNADIYVQARSKELLIPSPEIAVAVLAIVGHNVRTGNRAIIDDGGEA